VCTTSACWSLFVDCSSLFEALKSFRVVAIPHRIKQFLVIAVLAFAAIGLVVFFGC